MRPASSTHVLKLSLQTFASIWPVIILGTLLILAGVQLAKTDSFLWLCGWIDVAIATLVAFAAYNCILSGREQTGLRALQPKQPSALILFLTLSGVILFALGQLHPDHDPTPFNPNEFRDPYRAISDLVFGIFCFTVGIAVVSKFGTIFPAIVDGGDRSPSAASDRSRTSSLAWRVVGLFVMGMVLVGASLHAEMTIFGRDDRSFSAEIASGAISILILFYLATLLAALFSKAYLGSYASAARHR